METTATSGKMKRLWLDLGPPGIFGRFRRAYGFEFWQDHGMGLLLTILRQENICLDVLSLRSVRNWRSLASRIRDYDQMFLNVRSYTFPFAAKAAEIFKQVNPGGRVISGGIHATVAGDEMERIPAFDHICKGPGENVIADLARDPRSFPRLMEGPIAKSSRSWITIDRTLWPNPGMSGFPWPLEPQCGWGPAPVASVLTSRVCPWQCVFCNESAFIPNIARKPVEQIIEELNFLDRKYGPIGSVVIHDSMFFQQPSWLEEWLEKYPRLARKTWEYWAAARSDTMRRWPLLFEALVRETNWKTISIGFESGSDRMLKVLNKECTVEDNLFAINLVNQIADDLQRAGKQPPRLWANLMLGIPGETKEDAFATMGMLRVMKNALPSVSFYSPYPGSALGYQLIAEGKSLMTQENYHRHPGTEKVKGIDYQFYHDLLKGKFEFETRQSQLKFQGESVGSSPPNSPHHIYAFSMQNGKKKLAYGTTPADALTNLRLRLPEPDLMEIQGGQFTRISQKDLLQHVKELG